MPVKISVGPPVITILDDSTFMPTDASGEDNRQPRSGRLRRRHPLREPPHHRHDVSQDTGMLVEQGLGGAFDGRHAVPLGHRGALRRSAWSLTDEPGLRGG
jgi:hypothetical protein